MAIAEGASLFRPTLAATAAGEADEGGDVLRDLDRLQEVEICKDGQQITLRTRATSVIGPLFKAARVALPQNLRETAEA